MNNQMIGPCPWCSGKAVAQQYRARNWGCGCKTDACWVQPEAYATSRHKAISAWNTRAYNPDERLREALERTRARLMTLAESQRNQRGDYLYRGDADMWVVETLEDIDSALSPLPQGDD